MTTGGINRIIVAVVTNMCSVTSEIRVTFRQPIDTGGCNDVSIFGVVLQNLF
jgi:hypothetical protein